MERRKSTYVDGATSGVLEASHDEINVTLTILDAVYSLTRQGLDAVLVLLLGWHGWMECLIAG
jgi:hypothetical protein